MILQLNTEQKTAAEYDGGHVIVLAGAGTGKTRTIMGRAIHLIETGVDPARILLMTFTRRAAKEMIDRLRLLIGEKASLVTVGTFHHFCLASMRRMPKKFGIANATVIDRDDQEKLMKITRAPYVEKGVKFPNANTLMNWYSYARNTNQPAIKYLEKHSDYDRPFVDKILRVFTDYEKRKKQNGYLDFDDILFLFAQKIHADPEIRKTIKARYDHVLVDEMQDTNPIQWLILDGLRDPPLLFCVGDDAQSIYAFRGADFTNVHTFTKRVPKSKVLRLQENYRSTQQVLDLSNHLLSESSIRYGKKLKAHRGPGIRPKVIDFESEFDEAAWIANDLIERHETGQAWRDLMILTRTAYASRTTEAVLIEKKIPYVFVGGTSLLKAAHVKDLLCLVRCCLSHYDELAWMRYLTLWPGIGDVTASRLVDGIRQCSSVSDTVDLLRLSNLDRSELVQGIVTVMKRTEDPPKAVQAAAEFLEPMLEKRYQNWKQRKRDLYLMVQLAGRHKTLYDYLETYALDPVHTSSVRRKADEDVVTLITVHSAKGTEATTCYIIRAEPGMYPHFRSLGDHDEEEEERRILYVAMTRAKDDLILTRTMNQRGGSVWYGDMSGEHSRGGTPYFLETVPENLLDSEIVFDETFENCSSEIIKPLIITF